MKYQKNINSLNWVRKRFVYPILVICFLSWLLIGIQWLIFGNVTLNFLFSVLGLQSFLVLFLTSVYWGQVVELWNVFEQLAERTKLNENSLSHRRPILTMGIPFIQEIVDGIDETHNTLTLREGALEQLKKDKVNELGKATVRFKWVLEQLRPHLNSALGVTMALKTGDKQSRLMVEDLYSHITSSLSQALRLMNEYREITSMREQLSLYPEVVNIRMLCEAVIRSLASQIDKSETNLSLKYDADVAEDYLIDRLRVFEIYSVVLNYAIRFTQKGKIDVVLSQREKSSIHVDFEFLIRAVDVNAQPMSLEQLMEPFLHPDQFQLAVRVGSGPGLAFAVYKQIIEQMGGVFTITSHDNENKYLICLPFEKSIKGTEMEYSSEKNILIIDDNLLFMKTLARSLEKMSYLVDTAQTSDEALLKISKHEYDMIITDLYLGESDGITLTKQIRSIGYQRTILGMTATNTSEMRDRCVAAGMNDLLSKPFKIEEWRPALKNGLLRY